jgi:uncharacterized protein (DUF2235 family)
MEGLQPLEDSVIPPAQAWQTQTSNNSDGTNQPPTNVTKLARCVKHVDTRKAGSPIRQIVYYQSGIGSTSDSTIDKTFDGATGQGMRSIPGT